MKDLSADVSVFVITTGESTLLDCLAALRRQNCVFRQETIRNVSPLDAALQQILERCETPFYVQVDADMVLDENAIARLHRTIINEADDVMQVLVALHDVHLDMNLLGCRIVRTAIAKKYPYRAVQGCETDQMRRAAADGYRTIARIGPNVEPIGLHLLQPERRAVYERYRTLFRRARKGDGIDWVKPYARRFLDAYREAPNDTDLYALLGAVAGLTCPLDVEEGEKDMSRLPAELVTLVDHFGGAA